MVELIEKHARIRSLVAILCLFLTGNIARGTVLCFGEDGHIDFESAFHEHCGDHAHNQSMKHGFQLVDAGHGQARHCEPCVDVPVAVDSVKFSCWSMAFGLAIAAAALAPAADGENFNLYLLDSCSYTLTSTSYFTPLRTVILLA